MVVGSSSAPAVHVVDVSKRFGKTVALAGVDLDVAEGSVFGLLGPNGAGKTTLVRVLATLLAPETGSAEVFGHDVVREPAAVREMLGLTGQFAAVDEILTGRENLEMFGRLFDLSSAHPVTLTANTARSYALERGVPSSLGATSAWIAGLLVVFIPLCVWRYRRMS
jgi:ABC-type multidrug transport system ATPase subunit